MRPAALVGSIFVSAWVILALMNNTRSGKRSLESLRELVVSIAREQIGAPDWQRFCGGVTESQPTSRVAWCGIFSLWVLKQAGLASDLTWEWGKGFAYKLPMTNDPQPGDIAYLDQPYQHHAIVERVEGDQVVTVDGNQAGDTVAERVRPRSEFTAFFSIDPLLDNVQV